jgi:hypothetical protein
MRYRITDVAHIDSRRQMPGQSRLLLLLLLSSLLLLL